MINEIKVVITFNIHQNITYLSTNSDYESFQVEDWLVKNALIVT